MTNKDTETTSQETADATPDAVEQVEEVLSGEHVDRAANSNDSGANAEADEDVAAQLAEAKDQIREMQEGHLRAQAEVENIRRRSQNEVIQARKYAIEGFARELLTVKDSLDQAAQVELGDNESDAVTRMNEGLNLTLKQLDTAMEKFAVTEVEAASGVRFDPEVHQAISMVPSEEVDSSHIVSVMQKGYQLKDRLLRPAMVVVAS